MRTNSLTNLLGILILLQTANLKGQSSEMEINKNRISLDFVSSSSFRERIREQTKTKNKIHLILEKNNDSLFSIYVYNKTNDSLDISTQDGHLFLIQEAKNQNGEWKPIEYWNYSWCGNSYVFNKLEPAGILKTESKIYNGNFETEIRFKFLNDNKIYHSNSMKGFVNLSQFDIPDNITENRIYKRIEALGGMELLQKIIFLEPNGLKEFEKKQEAFRKK